MRDNMINIIGAGAAGLTAAVLLAKRGIKCRLIYLEESTSSIDVDDIHLPDAADEYRAETYEASGNIVDPNSLECLVLTAPAMLQWLKSLGAGDVIKALTAEKDRFEEEGLISSFPGSLFHSLVTEDEDGQKICTGVRALCMEDGKIISFGGRVIMATGGLQGFFPEMSNAPEGSGDAAAKLFADGVRFADLEMIEYLPGNSESIQFFPGGIDVDYFHQTSIHGLFAVGECCSAYHGAGVLEENKIVSAICGAAMAANFIADRNIVLLDGEEESAEGVTVGFGSPEMIKVSFEFRKRIGRILGNALMADRDETSLYSALTGIDEILIDEDLTEEETAWAHLSRAMLFSALERKESRGLHVRTDFPDRNDEYLGMTTAVFDQGNILTGLKRPVDNGGIPLTR